MDKYTAMCKQECWLSAGTRIPSVGRGRAGRGVIWADVRFVAVAFHLLRWRRAVRSVKERVASVKMVRALRYPSARCVEGAWCLEAFRCKGRTTAEMCRNVVNVVVRQ